METGRLSAGDIPAQMESLTGSAGICRRADRLIVRMIGDDRAPFLHGMCSNEINKLSAGTVTYALILTDHAHVVADFYAWVDDGAFFLDFDRALWPTARAHLEKFLVADDVEMEEQPDLTVIDIVGPQAAGAVTSLAPPATGLAPWKFVKDGDCLIANLPRIGLTAFTVLVPDTQAASWWSRLGQSNPQIREVSEAALEVLRVEQGLARVGVDATDKTIALEARLERGISYNKGCYVGQETVERATARGGIKKRLFGLRIEDGSIQPGAAVWLDGKQVGTVTSVAASPRRGLLALGIMHHSAWQPGTRVILKDGGGERSAAISELPFE